MRTCNKCNQSKDESEFYFLKNKPRHYCKICILSQNEEYRKKNKELISKKMKEIYYSMSDEKRLKIIRNGYETRNKWRTRNIEKTRIHYLIFRMKRKGLIKQLPCEVCGEIKTNAHHDDYSKPMDIRWLYQKHHRLHHFELKKKGGGK